MQRAIREFAVGDFRCRILCDGQLPYPEGLLSRELSQPDRARALRGYRGADGRVNVPCTALLVDTPRGRILLDTGAGALGPDTGQLPELLHAAGVTAESIDAVIVPQCQVHSGRARVGILAGRSDAHPVRP